MGPRSPCSCHADRRKEHILCSVKSVGHNHWIPRTVRVLLGRQSPSGLLHDYDSIIEWTAWTAGYRMRKQTPAQKVRYSETDVDK